MFKSNVKYKKTNYLIGQKLNELQSVFIEVTLRNECWNESYITNIRSSYTDFIDHRNAVTKLSMSSTRFYYSSN